VEQNLYIPTRLHGVVLGLEPGTTLPLLLLPLLSLCSVENSFVYFSSVIYFIVDNLLSYIVIF
jgi:hypothetical protein